VAGYVAGAAAGVEHRAGGVGRRGDQPGEDVEDLGGVGRAVAVGRDDAVVGELRGELRAELGREVGGVRTEIESVRAAIERSAKRTVLWLSGVIIAVGSLMVAAGGVLLSAVR